MAAREKGTTDSMNTCTNVSRTQHCSTKRGRLLLLRSDEESLPTLGKLMHHRTMSGVTEMKGPSDGDE